MGALSDRLSAAIQVEQADLARLQTSHAAELATVQQRIAALEAAQAQLPAEVDVLIATLKSLGIQIVLG